jgi:hypothetical protein
MKKETAMTLPPAAQAVRDAAFEPWQSTDTPESIAAAALRAAAEQVVPHRDTPLLGDDASYADWNARDDVRDQLLAIAAELEGAN